MEAILSCSRRGVNLRGSILFTTTFPCHNCAKHIIAAGVSQVIYVEPYPKSLAKKLHSDAIWLPISIDEPEPAEGKVLFMPFFGIGPRRFVDLFSMGWGSGYPVKRKEKGKIVEWERSSAIPRVPLLALSYMEREALAINDIKEIVEVESEASS
ncbi:MAG: hypothetical protein AB2L14_06275 [Candidatus Xenobiia bacterium LiM19]